MKIRIIYITCARSPADGFVRQAIVTRKRMNIAVWLNIHATLRAHRAKRWSSVNFDATMKWRCSVTRVLMIRRACCHVLNHVFVDTNAKVYAMNSVLHVRWDFRIFVKFRLANFDFLIKLICKSSFDRNPSWKNPRIVVTARWCSAVRFICRLNASSKWILSTPFPFVAIHSKYRAKYREQVKVKGSNVHLAFCS